MTGYPFKDEMSNKADNGKTPDNSQLESCSGDSGQIHERAGTRRDIKSRHAQMVAMGGSIDTALFVGAGQVLAIGGPAFLFLSYVIMSLLVYCVVTAVIEVGTHLPISGSSMAYYANRYVSRSLGFAMGWLYVYAFGIISRTRSPPRVSL